MYECNYLMLIMRLCSCNDDFLMVHGYWCWLVAMQRKCALFEYACVFVLYRMHMYTYTLHNLLYYQWNTDPHIWLMHHYTSKTETCFHCICIVNFYTNEMKVAVYGWMMYWYHIGCGAKIVHLLKLVYNAYTGASQKIRIWWKSLFFNFL